MRRYMILALVAVSLVVAGVVATVRANGGYQFSVLLGSATNLQEGGTVTMNGVAAGTIDSVSVQDGKALVTITLDDTDEALHDGAQATVEWKALLGERWVDIRNGPPANPTIPNGGRISGRQAEPTNIDQVLNALDKPTRDHLRSLVNGVNKTVQGNEKDTHETLRSAGPALASLGEVLNGVGADGPAIRDLVTQMNSMVGTLAGHDKDVRSIVGDLSRATSAAAQQREQLGGALRRLPGTLDTAHQALGHVPGVADKAVPLLRDLRPSTQQLPSVASNLTPVLRRVPPMLDKLGPTVAAADRLLDFTPGLLDSAHQTLPGLTGATSYLQPILNHLRPYTPELAGWVSQWTSNGANYDANGHFVRFYLQEGATTFSNNPGIAPPGTESDQYPLPGANANQPWKDAWGGGVR